LPNLLIAGNNFLLGLAHATRLCKGFAIVIGECRRSAKGTWLL